MIGLERITKTVELAIWSGWVKDEQPVSILLTSQPEAGKTELVMKFASNKGIVALTDLTAYGLNRDYGQQIRERKIRHIIIPDLIKPMSRGKDTVHGLVAFMNALIEEGVYRISTYAETVGVPTSGVTLQTQPIPVRCGLIATMAKDILLDGRHHWTRIGFMSRMLPISYEYGISTQLNIHKSIAEREYLGENPIVLELPDKDVEVELQSKEATDLMTLTTALTAKMATPSVRLSPEKVYGFRLQKNLQRLAMANALSRDSGVVEQQDVELIQELAGNFNLEYIHI